MKSNTFLFQLVPVSLAAFIFTGCGAGGRSFNYQARTSLEIGRTRISDCKTIFAAEPFQSETHRTPDGTRTVLMYRTFHSTIGRFSARVLTLEFRRDILNGFSYWSGFKEDKTKSVSRQQVEQIKKGVSTKSEVLSLLGQPNCMAKCPTVIFTVNLVGGMLLFNSQADRIDRFKVIRRRDGEEVWGWGFTQPNCLLIRQGKIAKSTPECTTVSFGPNDIVTDVQTIRP